MHPIKSIRAYWQALPPIIWVHLVMAGLLMVLGQGLKKAAAWALLSDGRVAVTTGDFQFLFTTWQGWVLMLLAIAAVYIYLAFDLCSTILVADDIVKGRRVSVVKCLKKALRSIKSFLCPEGMAVVAYIALVVPVTGLGFTTSLTERLRIPTFISAAIDASRLLTTIYGLLVVVLVILGFFGIFILHGVLIDNLSVDHAIKRSFRLIRDNWAHFLLRVTAFSALLSLFLFAVNYLLGYAIVAILPALYENSQESQRLFMVISALFVHEAVMAEGYLFMPLILVKVTQLYESYCVDKTVYIPVRNRHALPLVTLLVSCCLVGCIITGYYMNEHFDEFFPAESQVGVIAHRAGGVEAAENTVAGIEAAEEMGAFGSEIDIQRTSDGYYVVNHDNTFSRVAGDKRKPSQMTLEEVRQLRVRTHAKTAEGEPVPTLEEMLDASHGKMILFVELKGETADRKMADDVVRIVRERGMLDEVVFISLKYKLIDYLANTYPDAQTGFLAFGSYGDVASLNCDYLAIEKLMSTDATVDAIHDQDKMAFIWTINDTDTQEYFLSSNVDAIITDNVRDAQAIKEKLAQRSDLQRVLDVLWANQL